MKLPEMSVIDTHLPSNTKIRGYTTEQMLAWGRACAALVAAAEREACAKVCDGYSDGRHANMADLCAEAIRARGTT